MTTTTTHGRGRREGNRAGGPGSVTELAVQELRARILDGRLPMGAHLREQPLAVELGVGRPALREAMRLLEQERVIVHVPRAGSGVVRLTLQDAYEVATVREHLEQLAVRQGVPADPGRLAELDRAAGVMEANAAAGDEATVAADGLRFHRALIRLSGNTHLEAAYAAIAMPIALLMRLNRRSSARSEHLAARAARHRAVVDLVAAGDAEAVLAELRAHRTTAFLGGGALSEDGASPAALAWAERNR